MFRNRKIQLSFLNVRANISNDNITAPNDLQK
jgi:hypothetical protein